VPPEQPQPPDSPALSVVIVSRNQIAALRRTLAALLPAGSPNPPEVVVVDAGSRDGSSEVDSEFPAVRLVKMPHNFGRARARNIGVRTATGELILLLAPGVLLSPATLDRLRSALESDPRAAAVAPRLLDAAGEPQPQSFTLPSAAELGKLCFSGEPLASNAAAERAEAVRDEALLLRKSFIAGMNFFDEKRFGDSFAELDLFRQIKNANRDILILHDAPATLPGPEPAPVDPALAVCDRLAGAAAFIAKRDGAFAAISFQFKMFFAAFSAPNPFRLVSGLLSGDKIDGSQDGSLA
jgi:GT2 family glycosyltransferase